MALLSHVSLSHFLPGSESQQPADLPMTSSMRCSSRSASAADGRASGSGAQHLRHRRTPSQQNTILQLQQASHSAPAGPRLLLRSASEHSAASTNMCMRTRDAPGDEVSERLRVLVRAQGRTVPALRLPSPHSHNAFQQLLPPSLSQACFGAVCGHTDKNVWERRRGGGTHTSEKAICPWWRSHGRSPSSMNHMISA